MFSERPTTIVSASFPAGNPLSVVLAFLPRSMPFAEIVHSAISIAQTLNRLPVLVGRRPLMSVMAVDSRPNAISRKHITGQIRRKRNTKCFFHKPAPESVSRKKNSEHWTRKSLPLSFRDNLLTTLVCTTGILSWSVNRLSTASLIRVSSLPGIWIFPEKSDSSLGKGKSQHSRWTELAGLAEITDVSGALWMRILIPPLSNWTPLLARKAARSF